MPLPFRQNFLTSLQFLLSALAIIENRVTASPLPVPLARELRVLLRPFKRRTRGDEIDAGIDRVLQLIGDPAELFIYDILCTAIWDRYVDSGQKGDIERAAELLRQQFPSPREQITALERMFAEAFSYGVKVALSAPSLVECLCQNVDFRREFSDYLCARPAGGLGFQIRALLPVLRREDPAEYLRIGTAGSNSEVNVLTGS